MIETRPFKTVWDMPSPPARHWVQLGWKPLPESELEQQGLGPVLRPHILYGPMVAELLINLSPGDWGVAGNNHSFPPEAFEPYWMPVPDMPRRKAE